MSFYRKLLEIIARSALDWRLLATMKKCTSGWVVTKFSHFHNDKLLMEMSFILLIIHGNCFNNEGYF